MTRFMLTLIASVGVAVAASAGVVPPVPRVVLPPDALPPPAEGEPENPAQIAERIAKNTKSVGEKLAERDTGPDTLKDQDRIRRDLDALIKALENQPPMGGESNQQQPQGGGGGGGAKSQQPMGGQQPRGGQQPMGGSNRRRGGQQQPMGGQPQPRPMGQGQEPRDQPAGRQPQGGQPPMQPNAGGATPGIGGGAAQPTLPPAESLAKDFWGHLPELPRQRMMQFYREQYMSRYKDLLPQYYSSLAEKEKKAKK